MTISPTFKGVGCSDKNPSLALQIAANAQPLGTFEKALSLVRRAVAELELLQAGGGGWSRESTA